MFRPIQVFLILLCGMSVCILTFVSGCKKRDLSHISVIRIDGSSTVYPVMEAMAEEFQKVKADVRISVGVSGTGGGMKRFVAGELDIAGASRPIKESEEKRAHEHGLHFFEVPLAYDGLVVVVNPKNIWADTLTTEELKRIWQRGSTVKSWRDLRPTFPDVPVICFGPGPDSGTFDYFSEVIVGKAHGLRKDYGASEDDNVIVHGVQGEVGAIGFFGYAYYLENKDKLKAVGIDHGQGPVWPSPQTIMDATYTPLSRPLFAYVSEAAYAREAVKLFLEFIWDKAAEYLPEVGYLPLQPLIYDVTKRRMNEGHFGSLVTQPKMKGKRLVEIYKGVP